MANILISWIGITDLKASQGALGHDELGPIGQAMISRDYDELHLLADHPQAELNNFVQWLQPKSQAVINLNKVKLSSPIDFGDIYIAVVNVVQPLNQKAKPTDKFTYHLSPGTPAMAAVWILLSKTRFPAELLESSKERGVKTASVPFDISAEFIPDLFRRSDEELERLTAGLPPEAPEFEHIIHKSRVMQKVVARARRVAARSIPVLIEGESGTGKELFARAIHQTSPRRDKPIITVNCGAIPKELVESMLFGHKKGSFTGAIADHKGYFEAAHNGTLFLDEVGELPLDTQVKLLRVIQESEVTRVGEVEPRKIDVRIIAATNRSLVEQIHSQQFREDLYYRLAVAVLKLPPLREREGDLGLLIDRLLVQVNTESEIEPGYKHKNISVKARNIMFKHDWPGNIRELLNTIRSAAIWAESDKMIEADINEALLQGAALSAGKKQILNMDVSQGIDLKELLAEVARHYLSQALVETHNNKTKAAKLLGLGNYQTLSNWIDKYGLEK